MSSLRRVGRGGKLRKVVRAGKLGLVMLSTSVSMHATAATKFDPLDPLGTARKGDLAKKRAIAIEVAPGDWGGADVRDIKRVLDSVAAEFLSHVRPAREDISLRVIPRGGSPKVLYERGVEGQYVVQLTARDDRWFQYAFQFSHELCHVLSNFDHKEVSAEDKVAENNQWFEESLCETASLFTLRRLAQVWETNPPTRNWSGYGPVLAAYATRLTGETHRQLPTGKSFRDWYGENRAALRDNPYQREKNELVAAHLLPLFEARPELWQSIAYLNASRGSAGKPFAQYVADWQAASPDKTLPDQVRDLFGLPYGGQIAGVDPGDTGEAPVRAGPVARSDSVNGPAGE